MKNTEKYWKNTVILVNESKLQKSFFGKFFCTGENVDDDEDGIGNSLVEILTQKIVQDIEAEILKLKFGQDFEAQVWSTFWA